MNYAANKITDKIIELIKTSGELPWHKPWSVLKLRNAIKKNAYRGSNVMMLSLFGDDTEFVTFKQMAAKKGKFIADAKGKGIPVVFHRFEENEETGANEYKGMRVYTVFPLNLTNLEAEGKVKRQVVKQHDFEPMAQADKLAKASLVKVSHGGNRACYRLMGKDIQMPEPERFKTTAEYYATLFHEIGHALGDKMENFKENIDHQYSLEELNAEMFANIVCSYLGIERHIENSVAYLQNWLTKLQNEPTWLEKASRTAYKRFELLLSMAGLDKEENTSEA